MLYNLEESKQPKLTTQKELSQQALNMFYKNEGGLSGATFEIPYGVTRIRPYLFNNMWPENGFTVIVPDSVVQLADYAFSNADIREIYMSKNVKTIPEHCFLDCELQKLYLHKETSQEGYPWSYADANFEIVVVD